MMLSVLTADLQRGHTELHTDVIAERSYRDYRYDSYQSYEQSVFHERGAGLGIESLLVCVHGANNRYLACGG